ncbi:peptidoglycan DD-metalloendopeptidase family protein [Thioclava sp. SK-1]|uniref:peptidoglycan DD-metalloendopeptidase family protein n=1 Tax=Thioclava sp. SK-1 TaxID=1889770 RepID=UPI0009F72DF5|nr:peptidoglycan DD-metalloendopeptidase family protein [Thioclava sp. SK-1]
MTPLSQNRSRLRPMLIAGTALIALTACDPNGNFDPDLRKFGKSGFDTSDAALQATANRPSADGRGIISYPNYQVVVARRGDTAVTVAQRIGMDSGELARFNAVEPNAVLNAGAVLALPGRVAEPAGASGNGSTIDITTLASNALDRADATSPGVQTAPLAPQATRPAAPVAGAPTGPEPVRHKVARGETAYSIARYYNVSVRSVAEWNGLPSDMSVREGQFLMIPTAAGGTPAAAPASTGTVPGQGSPTPTPPSAAMPLPTETTLPASAPVDTSPAPDLSKSRSKASDTTQLQMPVNGAIIRPYVKKKNDGIDIAAAPGTAVKAADAGTVAAITKDTEQVPILVLRHDNGLLTVYANIDAITVSKGASVSRGQTIAKVRAGDPGYVHFEVRQGYDSVDPMPYLE